MRLNDEYYGALFHGIRDQHRDQYVNIAYMIQARPPFAITKVAREPYHLPIPEHMSDCFHHVAFSCSMAFVDGLLVIGYSVCDQAMGLYVDTVGSVFGDMEDVTVNDML